MKKLIIVTAALLGTVAATQAGVHFDFGVNIPLPGEVILGHNPAPIISQPAPVAYPASQPQVYAPAPVCAQPVQTYCPPAAAPVYCPPPTPVYCPPAPPVCAQRVIVAPRPYYPRYRGHEFYAWEHGKDAGRNWHHDQQGHYGYRW